MTRGRRPGSRGATSNDRPREVDQGGLEAVSTVDRVPSHRGSRCGALLVVATHAAYTTGKYTHGYAGLLFSRMEMGVPIFFVLSGYLLFGPWVKAVAPGHRGVSAPLCLASGAAHHAGLRHHGAGGLPDLSLPRGRPQSRTRLVRAVCNLTLTQIYTDAYMFSYLHQGLTQMWSLAVEVAFYVALPIMAYLLLVVVCRRRWRPVPLFAGLVGLTLISPAWMVYVHTATHLPDGARLWLPGYLAWFTGGMILTVLAAMGVRCYWFIAAPLAVVCYFIASTPVAGEPTTSPSGLAQAVVKTLFYMAIATLVVAPPALGDQGWYERFLASRPMVAGEISYEIFLVHLVLMEIAMVEVLHWRVYTGSMPVLFVVTLALSIPAAWLLHRLTRVRS